MLRDDIIEELEKVIPNEASIYFHCLESIGILHELCTAEVLSNSDKILDNFKFYFHQLYHKFGFPMTLKIHIICHLSKDYFDWTQKTIKFGLATLLPINSE